MRWLIGQDNKSYTAFQCLPVSANGGKLEVFTREMERNEFEADSMADAVCSYNGREPEDPMLTIEDPERELTILLLADFDVERASLQAAADGGGRDRCVPAVIRVL